VLLALGCCAEVCSGAGVDGEGRDRLGRFEGLAAVLGGLCKLPCLEESGLNDAVFGRGRVFELAGAFVLPVLRSALAALMPPPLGVVGRS